MNIDYTPTDRGDPDECSAANLLAEAEISARKSVTVTVDAVNDAPASPRVRIRRRLKTPERGALPIGPPLSLPVPTSPASR